MSLNRVGRRSARALLIDDGDLILIKRTRPGNKPYWTLPGGGVEPGDASLEAALERELLEELGATARIGPGVNLIGHPGADTIDLEHHFVARLVDLDPQRRCGSELDDPARGSYETVRVSLAPAPIRELDLRPHQARIWIADNTAVILACAELLADAPHPNSQQT